MGNAHDRQLGQGIGIERALLGLLRHQPLHAYEMFQQFARVEPLGRVWQLKQSHFYALLAKLEALGYVAGEREVRGSRPPRRMLRLTPAGEAAFIEWMAAPVRHGRDFRLEFLAKLAFADREGPVVAGDLLTRQRAECERWLRELREQADALPADARFERLVLRFRINQLDAILAWLDTCSADLAATAGH